jgi:hypothetical protein
MKLGFPDQALYLITPVTDSDDARKIGNVGTQYVGPFS